MTKATFKATWFGVFALCWVGFASPSVAQTQCIANVAAQGTSDAITSAQLPCGTTTNLVILTAAAANVTTAPTYAPVGSPPLPLELAGGGTLLPGDLQPGYVALLTSTGTSWVLLNPYFGSIVSNFSPGTSTIVPSTSGGVLWDNAGILGDSTTLPSGLGIPSVAAFSAGAGSTLSTPAAGVLGIAGGPNSAPTLGANDEGAVFLATVNGFVAIGKGSTYDVALLDSAGVVALGVKTGTTNIAFAGGIIAAALATPSGNIAGALCETSGGVMLYNAGANCYVGGGTAAGSNTQLQYNAAGNLGGISGVTSNGTAVTFADGDAVLAGSSSGTAVLHAPATGGGAVTFQGGAHTVASTTLADQTLSGGANVTVYAATTGNVTVDCGNRPLQYIANTGAFTVTAPTNDGSCILQIENGSGAGAVTFSGFSEGTNVGDALDTTNGHYFQVSIARVHAKSHYLVTALQ